jgi:hypothetical protein
MELLGLSNLSIIYIIIYLCEKYISYHINNKYNIILLIIIIILTLYGLTIYFHQNKIKYLSSLLNIY